MLGNERVDDLGLAFRGWGRGPREDNLDAQLSRRFVGAFVYGIEETIAERFGDDADAQLAIRLIRRFFLAATDNAQTDNRYKSGAPQGFTTGLHRSPFFGCSPALRRGFAQFFFVGEAGDDYFQARLFEYVELF